MSKHNFRKNQWKKILLKIKVKELSFRMIQKHAKKFMF